MPSVQKMVSRKSSITNAFVMSIIPVVAPTCKEIEQALEILSLAPSDVRCAYCGDKSSEWDHLRPLVINRRPSGFISEIANLVPSCGKCNQSKGNKPWREWMLSKAKLSPFGRGIKDIDKRIENLEKFVKWRTPTKVDFESILGTELWENYWQLCENVVAELFKCQEYANMLCSQLLAAKKK
jgi:hypothetical protein